MTWISLSEGHVQDTESRDDADDDGVSEVREKRNKVSLTHILKISNIYKYAALHRVYGTVDIYRVDVSVPVSMGIRTWFPYISLQLGHYSGFFDWV